MGALFLLWGNIVKVADWMTLSRRFLPAVKLFSLIIMASVPLQKSFACLLDGAGWLIFRALWRRFCSFHCPHSKVKQTDRFCQGENNWTLKHESQPSRLAGCMLTASLQLWIRAVSFLCRDRAFISFRRTITLWETISIIWNCDILTLILKCLTSLFPLLTSSLSWSAPVSVSPGRRL